MEYFKINGAKTLSGAISLHGAKNSVLPILSACVLISGKTVLHNCPDLSDVRVTIDILKYLGASVKRQGSTLVVDTSSIDRFDVPEQFMTKLRSSIVFLGAIANRTGKACLYVPGGCEIGIRPINLHLTGLKTLGYDVFCDGHNVCAYKNKMSDTEIVLPFPSVGATENIILASVISNYKTVIVNAAREPEIEDLIHFLNKAGARIYGENTSTIVIDGVKKLNDIEHTIISDRIQATTLMCATAITGGTIKISGINLSHIKPTVPVFEEMGCELNSISYDEIMFKAPKKINSVRQIETMAFPGFPTDCQAPVMASLTLGNKTSIIKETIFENRFMHTAQLNLFGADISVNDRIAVVNGVKSLTPTSAQCTDLRGGAAVVIAALACDGTSTIHQIQHIDRGYEKLENQLNLLGADVKRITYEKENNKSKIR